MLDDKLSKVENLVINASSVLGGSIIYGVGVNLSKDSIHAVPLFIGTTVVSLASIKILKKGTTNVIKKIKKR